MRINAFRRLYYLIAVVVMLVALGTACGSDDTEPTDPSGDTTTTTVDPSVDDPDDDDNTGDTDDTSTETDDNGEMVDTGGTDTDTETPDDSTATTTTVSTATTTTVSTEESTSFTEEEQAVADAWLNVFSPTTTWEEMQPHLQGIDDIEDVAREYAAGKVGQASIGVTLDVVSVTIEGTTANITFDILVGGSLVQPANPGVLALVDETWVVQRDVFCVVIAQADYSCDPPSEETETGTDTPGG